MTNYKKYYCYLNKGKPVIVKIKPGNHEELPGNYVANVPNFFNAERAYSVFLKVSGWRK